MNLSSVISAKRKAKHLTMQELGDMIGVNKTTISRWESGIIKDLKYRNMEKLSCALGIDLFSEFDDFEQVTYAYQIADDRTKRAVRELLNIEK